VEGRFHNLEKNQMGKSPNPTPWLFPFCAVATLLILEQKITLLLVFHELFA